MSEVVEAEVVESTDLEPVDQSATLFRSDDPVEVLAKATRIADALKDVISQRGLTTQIQGKHHVQVEGWQTLGAMLGITPVCVWTKPLDNGWEARVEAWTLDGRIVGAAEAMCTRSERMWKNRDDYALRSMAQTRATSKALASPLRFVITLAGYEGTPAEEMTFAEQPYSLARLERAGADMSTEEKQAVGAWVFNGGGSPDQDRLRQAIDRIENGDAKGLLGHVSVALGVENRG